jgi:pyruvate,water dikinase
MTTQPAALPLMLPLASRQATVPLAGGKGAALARLATAGLPVPNGFLITTAAYRRFTEANAIQLAIDAALAAVDLDDQATLASAAAAIQARFDGGSLLDALRAAMLTAYASLGDMPAVAVRSSATAEDLPGHSFAGQQETLLNVRGAEALLAAVRSCWASLWSARAIAYRERLGVGHADVAMAVVVQVMVAADVSGVLFTANPATGERSELLLNASYGLGEAIVSGAVTPDSFTIERQSRRVRRSEPGTKELMVAPTAGQGVVSRPVPTELRDRATLAEPQLRELAALGLGVEQLFGGQPQDIEWALEGGRFWLLQSRPITSLPPEVHWEPPTPGSTWLRRQVVEHMPDPLSPLFADLYLHEGLERSLDAMQRAMGVPRRLREELMDRPYFATVNGYAYMRGDLKLRWWTIPLALAAMAAGVTRLLQGAGITYWRDEELPAYKAAVAHWGALDPRAASDAQLLAGIRALAYADARYWYACTLAVGTAKVVDSLLDQFLGIAARGQGLSAGLFLRGFPSPTLAAQEELEALAARVSASEQLRALVNRTPAAQLLAALEGGAEGEAVLTRLEAYLAHHGHQIYTLDFAEPTQADEPLPVLVGLRGLVQRPGQHVRQRQAALAAERAALEARTAEGLGPLRQRLFRRLVAMAQHFGPYREEALFYLGAGWPTLRQLARELGRRLVAAGTIAAANDVFFLRAAELEVTLAARAAGEQRDLAALVAGRRVLREQQRRLRPPVAVPPSFRMALGPIDLSSRETQRRNSATSDTLAGFAVSPGRVTAPASVIRSPAEFGTMEPGTILVCPTTTPAWTPLFAQARGLVTDIGGVLAHGSIVAREYGIPAVMGTGSATERIVSGQLVTVDGDAGTVTLAG